MELDRLKVGALACSKSFSCIGNVLSITEGNLEAQVDFFIFLETSVCVSLDGRIQMQTRLLLNDFS